MPGHHGRLGLRSVSRIGIYQHSMRVALGASSGPDLSDLTATAHVYAAGDYQGISWNDDGLLLFLSQDTARVEQFDVSPAYSLVEADRTESEADRWVGDTGFSQVNDHYWSLDGKTILTVTSGDDKIHWATLTAAFDLSTAGSASSSDISGDGTIPVGLTFDNTETEMFISYNASSVKKYTLSTKLDPSTRGSATTVLDLTTNQTGGGQGIDFAPDGMKFYSVDITDAQLDQFNLTAAYNLTTSSFQSGQAKTLEANCHGCWVRKDGSEIYVSHNSGNRKLTVLA